MTVTAAIDGLDTRHPLRTALDACAPLAINPPLDVLGSVPPPESDGARWFRIDELADPATVAPLIEAFRASAGITHRAAGGIRFFKELVRDPLYVAVATTFLVGTAPDVGPDNLWLRWSDSARAGTPALARATTSPAGTDDALDAWLARRLVAAFGPLVDAVRTCTRAGTRLLWGYVSDMTHFRMLQAARETGADARAAWRRADRLCAAYVAAGAPIRSAPRQFELRAGEPPVLWAVRGVCCLDYRADPAHGYCATCPTEDDEVRRDKLSWLLAPPASPA